jgi:ABC-type antimicrobial peptide transport system permease subunit
MVDISGLVRAFASNSLLFAAIGDDFKPCSKVYMNADPSGLFQKSSHAVSYLKSDPRFADKNFEDLDAHERKQVNFSVLEVIIRFSVALAALLSSVVVFCCFYILANERTEENQALAYSGAGPRVLGVMQYAEVILYWVFGVPLGILLSVPTVKVIPFFVDLQYVEPSINLSSVIKSVFILLAVCILTTTFFIFVSNRMRKKGATYTTISAKWTVYLSAGVAVLYLLMYLLPANPRLTVFIFTIAAIVALVFCLIPLVVKRIVSAIEKRMRGAKKPASIAFQYALKNVCSLKLLHNIARLCALIVMIILTVCLIFASVSGQLKNFRHMFDADYIVFNATDSCYEKTQTCQSADAVYRAYVEQTSWCTLVSADDPTVYADGLKIDRQPIGNEAVVSIGIAHTHNLKIGDTFPMILGGVEYEFVVSQITRVPSGYIAVNCQDMNIPYNMLLVKGKDDVAPADLLGDLSQTTASELAPLAEVGSLLEKFIDAIQMYKDSGKILLLVFVVFSLIGMIDIFYESLRARREEFGLYRLAGMEQRQLCLMKVLELTITLLFGIVIGLGAFVLVALAVNRGMTARGMEIFLGIFSSLN